MKRHLPLIAVVASLLHFVWVPLPAQDSFSPAAPAPAPVGDPSASSTPESPAILEDEINRLQTEINNLDSQISDPSLLPQRRALQEQLFEKIRNIHQLKRKLRDAANQMPPSEPMASAPVPAVDPSVNIPPPSAPAPISTIPPGVSLPSSEPYTPPPPVSSEPALAPESSPLQVPADASMTPSAPASSSGMDVDAEIQQLQTEINTLFERIRRLHEMQKTKGGGPTTSAPSPATRPSPSMTPVAVPPPDPRGLTLYTAEDLGIGRGTQQNLEEIARFVRGNEFSEARREWISYLSGEIEMLRGQGNRVEALIHYIARQAHVEMDTDISAYAAQVDSARRSGDATLTSQAQGEFMRVVSARSGLLQGIQNTLGNLRQAAREVIP